MSLIVWPVTCGADIPIHKEMSHWRRIVIDSRYKTDDSASDSDFHIQIPYPVRVPQGSHMFVEGVTLGHSWPTISTANNKVYVEEQVGGH